MVGVVSPQAMERRKQEVETEHSGRQVNVESMQLDLSSFRSTKEFVDTFKAKNLPLHLLINNAGVAWLQQLSEEPMSICLCVPHGSSQPCIMAPYKAIAIRIAVLLQF